MAQEVSISSTKIPTVTNSSRRGDQRRIASIIAFSTDFLLANAKGLSIHMLIEAAQALARSPPRVSARVLTARITE